MTGTSNADRMIITTPDWCMSKSSEEFVDNMIFLIKGSGSAILCRNHHISC